MIHLKEIEFGILLPLLVLSYDSLKKHAANVYPWSPVAQISSKANNLECKENEHHSARVTQLSSRRLATANFCF